MIELNEKRNQLSLKDLAVGRYLDKDHGWMDIDESVKEEIAEEFKKYVLTKCRKNSKVYERIENVDFTKCETYAIYDNLRYTVSTGEVDYIAGQDHQAEIKRLKKLIVA